MEEDEVTKEPKKSKKNEKLDSVLAQCSFSDKPEDSHEVKNSVSDSETDLKRSYEIDPEELNGSETSRQFIIDESVSICTLENVQVGAELENEELLENFCRICHDMDQDEQLISPCKCKGSLSLVHLSCLQHWLAESDSSRCELCGFMYFTRRVPKYSVFKSIMLWLHQNRRQRREVLIDLLAALSFIPMCGMGTYIGLLMAEGLPLSDEVNDTTWTSFTGRVMAVSFISLMTTLDVAYATWIALRFQHHVTCWYSWYRRNSEVTLVPPVQE